MKFRLFIVCLMAIALGGTIGGCKKNIPYQGNILSDYYIPLQVGKYITYRMDSLNFYFDGQIDTITSYLAKDSVERKTVDGSGATVWLITRYLSDTLGSSWSPRLTYVVSPSASAYDVTEDNLRFIKLAFPMDQGFSWTGNTYLPYNPYQDYFYYSDFNNLTLSNWNYQYTNVNQPFTVANGTTFDSATTILQIADSSNVPITNVNAFATDTYWSETYAKHVGMIYRYTVMWEWQPPPPDGSTVGYKIGFALTMSIVDHN